MSNDNVKAPNVWEFLLRALKDGATIPMDEYLHFVRNDNLLVVHRYLEETGLTIRKIKNKPLIIVRKKKQCGCQ